jgi:hypothetical protein
MIVRIGITQQFTNWYDTTIVRIGMTQLLYELVRHNECTNCQCIVVT